MKETGKNKRTTVYLLVLTAFTLVVLVSAAWAFYVNDITFGDNIPANTYTAPKVATFISNTSGEIGLSATQKAIGQYDISTTPISTSNATATINLTGTTEYETTYCYYDLIWQYTSTDKYTTSDVTLPHTGTDGKTYPFELSLKINTKAEKDLSTYTWDDTGKTTLVKRYVIGTAQGDGVTVTQNWNFLLQMYNIDAEQTLLFDRSFSAFIKAENPTCYTKNFEEKVHPMTINYETGDVTELASIPNVDDGYTLDTDRTFCAKGGTLSGYNSSTGTFNTVPAGDECYAYFDKVA